MEFRAQSSSGLSAHWFSLGATLAALHVPDRHGILSDVVLGYDSESGYAASDNPYFGCTVGRFANRIARGRFALDGQQQQLPCNEGAHHLHGGVHRSFSRVDWHGEPFDDEDGIGVRFTYHSPDGEEGYPGNLEVTTTYTLARDCAMTIAYSATTDAPTIVNLTNHSYFNLAGHDAGSAMDHRLQVEANRYVETDSEWIPTGALMDVEGTALDFRSPQRLGDRLARFTPAEFAGFNHCLELSPRRDEATFAAILASPSAGRQMRVLTTQPGLQLYAGYFLDGQAGKAGVRYMQHAAVCLETQHFPNAPNHANFPCCVLRPGEVYHHSTRYEFSNE